MRSSVIYGTAMSRHKSLATIYDQLTSAAILPKGNSSLSLSSSRSATFEYGFYLSYLQYFGNDIHLNTKNIPLK